MTQIWTKRAYAEAHANDGTRILVDRVWPRGVSKEDLDLAAWEKDVAPSKELRQWFDHDPEKWNDFRDAYFSELDKRSEAVDRIADQVREGRVTLIYGAKDEHHNNAVALKEYLERRSDT
ncbi:hypothetical protein A3731_36530 [Roseovarius sp. HI0049]|nr:hypothetical protein A3731_16515 [Roseovarius sp. HI0049]KZY41027.1 hypothetical protein A3731_36530 [Roseovarius sp. HI0049]